MTFTVTFIEAFAWSIVLIAGAWLAGLRNGERTRLPRIELRGNFLRMKFGLFWRV